MVYLMWRHCWTSIMQLSRLSVAFAAAEFHALANLQPHLQKLSLYSGCAGAHALPPLGSTHAAA